MDEEQAESALLAVLDHYGLREPGYGERAAHCPVHDDAHMSASMNRSKGLWNCHACGAGGSAANIVMAREGVDFPAAMRFIEGLGVESSARPQPTRRGRRTGRWVPPSLRSSA